jgi:hypothetical protein
MIFQRFWNATSETMAFGFLLILILGIGSPASAQSLDLDGGPKPPVLNRSILDEIAERFADDGGTRRDETGALATIAEAQRNLQRIAVELAHRGGGAGDAAMVAGLLAIRLTADLSELDAMFDTLAQPGAFGGSPPRPISEESREAAIERLRDFNQSALDLLRRSDTGTLQRLDATLSTILAPIRRVISLILDRPIMTRWPNDDSIRSRSGTTERALAPLPTRVNAPEADLAMAQSDDGLSGTDAMTRRRLLRSAVQAIDTLSPGTEIRKRLEEILDTALLRLAIDPSDRAGLSELLVVEQASRIAGNIDEIASMTSSSEFDPDRFRTTLENTLDDPIDESTILLLGRQLEIATLLKAGIDALDATIDRDLRNAQREIHRRHRRVVRTTTLELDRLGGDPAALADPATNSIIAALRSTAEDLDRLRVADELTAKMTSLRPGAAREFRRRIRGWCRMLGEDSTRSSGAEAIDGLRTAFEQFAPIPFEDRLAEPDPEVDRLTGGRRVELLERIVSTREAWADEVANGELDGTADSAMNRLARLGSVLRSLHTMLDAAVLANVEICNRWGGWFTARIDLSWLARTVMPGVRLASIAAADGDAARFERDLAHLESQTPPVMLLDWLSRRVAIPMADRPSGAVATIAALSIPPGEEAWGTDLRVDLAAICRGFAELAAARARRDDGESVERLTAYLVDASDDLLERITAGIVGDLEIQP